MHHGKMMISSNASALYDIATDAHRTAGKDIRTDASYAIKFKLINPFILNKYNIAHTINEHIN